MPRSSTTTPAGLSLLTCTPGIWKATYQNRTVMDKIPGQLEDSFLIFLTLGSRSMKQRTQKERNQGRIAEGYLRHDFDEYCLEDTSLFVSLPTLVGGAP